MQTEGQKFINEIDECMNSVSALFEKQKKYLVADLNFFENAFKSLSSNLNEIKLMNETQGTSSTSNLSGELVGVIISNFPKHFQKLLAEIKFNTIPKLKDHIAIHTKNSQQYNSRVSNIIQNLKKSYKTFVDSRTKFKQKQQEMPLSDTINNILDTGSKFNNLYIDLSKNIENTEEQLTKELLDAEKYFTKLKEDEYIVVYIASQLVIDIYNFIPNVKQEENKRVDAEFLMASRVDKIRELLCSLRDSVTNSRAFAKPIGMVPKSWEDEQTEPFYARVWKSFDTNKPGELKASKKSLVLVKNATQHAYWEVEKMNGEVGYFPCCLLEPLRE